MLVVGIVAVCVQVVTVLVAVQPEPNKLAAALLQAIAFALGAWISYVLGRASATEAARDIVRPHAKAATRRAWSLYRALDRQRAALTNIHQELSDDSWPDARGRQVIDLAAAQWAIISAQSTVIEQMSIARDAIADWGDLLEPDPARALEVESMERG